MNKKGFTLVEVISVIVLLGLIIVIAVPNILGGSNKSKEIALNSKIENIEKAAVLYGQDNRNLISLYIDGNYSSVGLTLSEYKDKYEYCYKDGTLITNCYYYLDDMGTSNESDDITAITVGFLANPDGVDSTIDGYINYDKEKNVVNPTNEDKSLNDCEIQIYQKYGKIYAVYTKKAKVGANANTECGVD